MSDASLAASGDEDRSVLGHCKELYQSEAQREEDDRKHEAKEMSSPLFTKLHNHKASATCTPCVPLASPVGKSVDAE